jgi:rhodanese-related sulfurtransferase
MNKPQFLTRRLASLALCTMLWLPMSATANLSLLLFGPKDWPSTIAVVREKFPQVRQITTSELATQLAVPGVKPLLLDTRTKDEYAASHLVGALHAETEAQATAVIAQHPNRSVVLYCSVGYRSSALADKLMRHGTKNIANLEGSIFAWANEGRPVVKGSQPVTTVHPYNAKWGKLLNRGLWAVEP